MKLKPFKLPCEPTGAVSETLYLNLEFIRRLKAYAAFYKCELTGPGYRSVYDQASAYLKYKNDPEHNNPAAYPGESWHNCALAKDIRKTAAGIYPATMPDDYHKKPTEQAMNMFGLCIPMWAGSPEKEPWHVVPIECLGVAGPDRQWFLDADDRLNSESGYRVLRMIKLSSPVFTRSVLMRGNDVKILQQALKITADGVFGEKTEQAVSDYQDKNGLTIDGICGPEVWSKLVEPDYKQLYNESQVYQADLKRSISVKIKALDDILQGLRGDLN